MMDEVLRGLNSFVGVYLDDIVIYSGTWEEHSSAVRSFHKIKGSQFNH